MAFGNFITDNISTSHFGDTAIYLAVMYFATLVLILNRMPTLCRFKWALDIKSLFITSIMWTVVLRMITWIGIGILSYNAISVGGDDDGVKDNDDDDTTTDDDQEIVFYNSAVYVLFDLPDFILLSTYTLLGLLWGEMNLRSRKHWLSLADSRHPWIVTYTIFNICLYATQLIMYTLLFVNTHAVASGNIIDILNLIIALLNYSLPVIFIFFWIYFSLKFAGFPWRSPEAQIRLQRTGKAMLIWTIARIIWGICVLSATQTVQPLVGDEGASFFFSLLVVMIFLVCEIYPFFVALDKELLVMLSLDDEDMGGNRASMRFDTYRLMGDSHKNETRTQEAMSESSFSVRDGAVNANPYATSPDTSILSQAETDKSDIFSLNGDEEFGGGGGRRVGGGNGGGDERGVASPLLPTNLDAPRESTAL